MHDYYSHPALSQSKLKDLKKSPKHFWAKHIDPNRQPPIETEAMQFGAAVHTMLFEFKDFNNQYVVLQNKIDKRTKEGKLFLEKFRAENKGKIILNPEEFIIIQNIRTAVLNKKSSHVLLHNGIAEHEIYWKDEETGVECKGKLDYWIAPTDKFPNGIIVDYKTTQNAELGEFANSIYKFGYYNQAAWYAWGIKELYKTSGFPLFIFIAGEKDPPYESNFLVADETMIRIGLQENRRLLNLYNECLNSNKWYGYIDQIQEVSLPAWIINKFENV